MFYPVDQVLKKHSSKLNVLEFTTIPQNNEISTKNPILLKLPTLKKNLENKTSANTQSLKSILKKSQSLELTQQTAKRLVRNSGHLKYKSKIKKESLEDSVQKINRIKLYKNYIETLNHSNISSISKIKKLNIGDQTHDRKSQIPLFFAQKKYCHRKNKSTNYNRIMCNQTFVRFRSPEVMRFDKEERESSTIISKHSKFLKPRQGQSPTLQRSSNRTPVPLNSHISCRPSVLENRNQLFQKVSKHRKGKDNRTFTPWKDDYVSMFLDDQANLF